VKIFKLSSIFLLSGLFLSTFIPEAEARGYCRSYFGFNVNIGNPGYVVQPAPVVAAPVVAPAPVMAPGYMAAPGYVAAPVPAYQYYYAAPAPAPVVVERRPRVYVQPGFSFHGRWR
jgi:hypothetical protein